jgi:hypothetical protein
VYGQVVFDASHGGTNDIKLTIKHLGLWGHEILAVAAAHAPFSPYGTGQRRSQVFDAVEEYLSTYTAAECPIFHSLIMPMLEERGESYRISEPGYGDKLAHIYMSRLCNGGEGGTLSVSSQFTD